MSEHYDFHYQPTGSGAISGQQVLQQTEDAINELGDYVNDNVGGAMDVAQQALETAQTAETNAQTALDTANSFSSAIQSAQQDASTALSTAQTAQTTASNANNTAIQAQQDASSAVTTANNASGQVSTLSGTVTALGQRVTTAEGNIGQNTSDITALTTRVGTAEGSITTLQNDVSIAQGNASSAMATAGTVKQQAYVFRYSSTALTASSTNSNTLLDNTDNLKVGDKVIDSNGVLFSITAIDTVNSTFTIGSALIDLAKDIDVVHTSGAETIGGIKSFSDDTYIKSVNFTNEVPSPSSSSSAIMPLVTTVTYTDQTASKVARINLRITASGDKSLYPHENNQYALGLTSRKWSEVHATTYYYGSSDTEFSAKFVTTDTAQTISGAKTLTDILTGTSLDCTRVRSKSDPQAYIVFRQNDQALPGSIVIRASDGTGTSLHIVGGSFRSYIDNTVSLGTSSYKWTNVATNAINGLEPSALGMPDLNNGIDISSYITIGNTDDNYYTPPVNGWIWARMLGNDLAIQQGDFGNYGNYVADSTTGDKYVEACLLVTKNVRATIRCRGITSIVNAKFYPCQGNV